MRKEEKRRGKFPWGLPGIISLGVWLPFVSRREAGDWRDKKRKQRQRKRQRQRPAHPSQDSSRVKPSRQGLEECSALKKLRETALKKMRDWADRSRDPWISSSFRGNIIRRRKTRVDSSELESSRSSFVWIVDASLSVPFSAYPADDWSMDVQPDRPALHLHEWAFVCCYSSAL